MPSVSTALPGAGRASLSIDVEDWFHTENLRDVIAREAWDGCELRVEQSTMRMLEILATRKARATFFVLGWVAERCPRIVRAIAVAVAGHEVASHGYGHELIYSLEPSKFRADVLRSKRHLEDLIGKPVRGYRAPCFSITPWAVPILQEVGFEYDSSVVPTVAHDRYGRLHGVEAGKPVVLLRDGFYEVCISCICLGKRGLPWGGGGYFRLVPYSLWGRGVRAILRSGLPYVFYIHPWEIDPGQPRVKGLKGHQCLPPTCQPQSLRGAFYRAGRCLRVGAVLRSDRSMEGEFERHAAAMPAGVTKLAKMILMSRQIQYAGRSPLS